jgi:creatinine amidohydrolase
MFETLSQELNKGTELAAYSWRGLRDLKSESVELPVMSCWLRSEAYYDYVRGKGRGVYNLPPVPEEAFIKGRGFDRELERGFLGTVESKYGKVHLVPLGGKEVPDIEYEVVLGNFGVIEQHGFHLPLDADNIRIYGLIGEVLGEGLIDDFGGHIQMPSLSYGITGPYEMDFPGTINTGPDILEGMSRNYVSEIAGSLGGSDILFLTAHNHPLHRGTIERVVDGFGDCHSVEFVFDFGLLDPEMFKTRGHAGRYETSVIMHYRPGMVDLTRARGGRVDRDKYDKRGYVDRANIGNRSGANAMGDNHPSLSIPWFGKRYVDSMANEVERLLYVM